MTDKDFWIPISFGSEETEEKIRKAISICWKTHVFTLETLNDYFIDHAEPYLYRSFRRELNIYLNGNMPFHTFKEKGYVQRYSLIRAAEKTFPYFTENKSFKNKKFTPVEPIPEDKYTDIQIDARKVWKKFMALNSLITTVYGTIFLDDIWADILKEQATQNDTPFEMLPFLWHSVVVRLDGERQEIRFNLHNPKSDFGKKAKREMRETNG